MRRGLLGAGMGDDTKTGGGGWLADRSRSSTSDDDLGLMIAWSFAEPHRAGEVAIVRGRARWTLGRGAAKPEDSGPRLVFVKLRPGASPSGGPLMSPALSRRQLEVCRVEDGLEIVRTGKVGMTFGGNDVDRATVRRGDVIVLRDQLVLMCVERSSSALGSSPPSFPFGAADALGIVGESPAAWALRDTLDFQARRAGHVLVTGPSGSGKELAARAIHALSSRRAGPFIARNAATIPEGIVDAELFGNAKDYPNAGMRERAGLVGEAHGGTLFLDEVGELPESIQAHLLRLLDDGEYHRLGDDRSRRADVRVVAATNRPESALKADLLARFPLRVVLPGLNERVCDVPLLARAILAKHAACDPEIVQRFFEAGEPRVAPELVAALLKHDYETHVRELDGLLRLSMSTSRGPYLALTPAVRERLPVKRVAERPSRSDVVAALEQAEGNVSRAWKLLGLSSRDALNRLLKKYEIGKPRRGGADV